MLRPEAPTLNRSALVADSLSLPYGWTIRLPRGSISGPLRRNSGVSVWPARTEIVVPSLAVTDKKRPEREIAKELGVGRTVFRTRLAHVLVELRRSMHA